MIPHCFGSVEVPAVGRPIQDWKCFILVFLSKCAFAALVVSGQDIKRFFFLNRKNSITILIFWNIIFSSTIIFIYRLSLSSLYAAWTQCQVCWYIFSLLWLWPAYCNWKFYIQTVSSIWLPHCAPSALSENSLPPQNLFSLIVCRTNKVKPFDLICFVSGHSWPLPSRRSRCPRRSVSSRVRRRSGACTPSSGSDMWSWCPSCSPIIWNLKTFWFPPPQEQRNQPRRVYLLLKEVNAASHRACSNISTISGE